jgi:hypothetical protein
LIRWWSAQASAGIDGSDTVMTSFQRANQMWSGRTKLVFE